MSLLYNPQKSGKGVAKKEPEKKPFFKFFELFGRKFWKLLQLNFIYLICCLPVFTIGPATAALTQVMRKFVLEQPIFVFEEFRAAFKKNFKQSLIIGILDVVFLLFWIVTLYSYVGEVAENPTVEVYTMIAMMMASGVIFLTVNLYIYPQIVCLNLKLPAIFKNAALLGVVGLKRNAVTVVCYTGVITTVFLLLPYSIFILPLAPFAWLAFLGVFNAYPVIQKYIINPYYESRGEVNPELAESVQKDETQGGEQSIFTDLGGKEQAINKKKIKTGGKLIK